MNLCISIYNPNSQTDPNPPSTTQIQTKIKIQKNSSASPDSNKFIKFQTKFVQIHLQLRFYVFVSSQPVSYRSQSAWLRQRFHFVFSSGFDAPPSSSPLTPKIAQICNENEINAHEIETEGKI